MRSLFTFVLVVSAIYAQDPIPATDFGRLFFTYERGGKTPPPQTLSLGSEERRPVKILLVNSPWLHVSINSDDIPDTLTFTVDPIGLEPGILEGSLLFTLGDTEVGTAGIRLTILDPARFIAIPDAVTFTVSPNATSIQTQSLYVTAANQPASFTVTTNADSKFLSVTPSRGNTPANPR